jgi:hypothetical protein
MWPPLFSAVYHPGSVEAATLSGLMGFARAYLRAAAMISSMCAHGGHRLLSKMIRAVAVMPRVPVFKC